MTKRWLLWWWTTEVECARLVLLVMMLLEQFSHPSSADQRCPELWLAWTKRTAMLEMKPRASEVCWHWSTPSSMALSPIGMTWRLAQRRHEFFWLVLNVFEGFWHCLVSSFCLQNEQYESWVWEDDGMIGSSPNQECLDRRSNLATCSV